VISNAGFKATQRKITQKLYKTELYLQHLQWRTNKKMFGLLNSAIFNDLEQLLTQFSRSRYTLTLNISNG